MIRNRSKRPFIALWVPGLALALLMLAPATAPAQRGEGFRTHVITKDHTLFLSTFRSVVAQARKSTVTVLCDDKPAVVGTVVDRDGLILTKASEVRGEVKCVIRGRELPARVVGRHDAYDLALLKVDATDLKPVAWGRSKDLGAGMWLASVGTTSDPVAVGVVSVPTRDIRKWNLPRNVNPAGGFLGIATDQTEEGVEIIQVVEKTAAERAKLRKGDILLSIRGHKVKTPADVFQALKGSRPGDTVKIKIAREEEEMEFTATLGKRPAVTRSEFQNSLGSELSTKRTGFPSVLQHDAVIKPDECGGPVVGLDGKVVGINIARAGRTESYAVPSEAVKSLLADYKAGKLALGSGSE
jgi:serine protease Do